MPPHSRAEYKTFLLSDALFAVFRRHRADVLEKNEKIVSILKHHHRIDLDAVRYRRKSCYDYGIGQSKCQIAKYCGPKVTTRAQNARRDLRLEKRISMSNLQKCAVEIS